MLLRCEHITPLAPVQHFLSEFSKFFKCLQSKANPIVKQSPYSIQTGLLLFCGQSHNILCKIEFVASASSAVDCGVSMRKKTPTSGLDKISLQDFSIQPEEMR
jgi:hypothetical protein